MNHTAYLRPLCFVAHMLLLAACGGPLSAENPCAADPCENGGVCLAQGDGFVCTCAAGFEGATCETNIDDCSGEPCLNGGTCTDGVDSFSCTCPAGYEGTTCESNIDDCASQPCQNGGTCTDGVDSFTCTCAAGFEGATCESNIDDCASQPCQNGGTCTDGVVSFTCTCAAGFEGATCESNIDDCAAEPCLNGGTCTDGVDSFTCSCAAGFEGATCGTNIDDCAAEPCLNGGTCTDGVDSFTCTCAAGFEGTTCATNIDDCASQPCLNGGTCTDGVATFSCTCPWDYVGDLCETRIGACTPTTCQNGGTCIPGAGTEVSCDCAAGFAGELCEVDLSALCAVRLAECGPWYEPGLGKIDCGTCAAGSTCVANACEPVCSSDLFDGTTDGLFAHVPNHVGDADISANAFEVTVQDDRPYTMYMWRFEEWTPRTDLEQKSLTIDFGTVAPPTTYTLSFRLIDADPDQIEPIARSGDIEIWQEGSAITATAGSSMVTNGASVLETHDCNHYALVIDGTTMTSYLNGEVVPGPTDATAAQLGSTLTVGPYPARLWDIRVYDRALTELEVDDLAGECQDQRVAQDLHPGYPHYQCGVYSCLFWDDATNADPFALNAANVDFWLYAADDVIERNIMVARMYPPGELCSYLAAGDPVGTIEGHTLLEPFLLPFINGFSFNHPRNDHWFHENFHGFQGQLFAYRGRGGSRFAAESTANWAVDFHQPMLERGTTDLGAYTRNSHVPLDAGGTYTRPAGVLGTLGGHMYGAFIWNSYLTFQILGSPAVIGTMYDSTTGGVLERYYEILANLGFDMRELFMDFAARNATWDYGEGSESYAAYEAASAVPDYKLALDLDGSGTGGVWTAVPVGLAPGTWAYNTYRVSPALQGSYQIDLRTAADTPADVEFRAMVVAHNETTGERRYLPLGAAAPGEIASIDIVTAQDEVVYLIVAVTPPTLFLSFDQTYDYEIAIAGTAGPGYVPAPIDPPPPANEPPVISVVADVATTEYATVDIDVSCSDPETAAALPVTMSALDTCGGALTGGTYSFATSEQDGETGCEAVFECSDGIDVSIARTHVAIAEANQPPVVDPFGAPAAGSEGIVQLSATDLDEPAHFLTWSLAAQPTCAAAYVDLDGRLVYRCSEAALCDATVEVTDGYADGTVAATVPLDCTGVAPPAAFDVRVKGDVSVEGQASECFYRFLAPSGAADASTVEWLVGSTVIATGAIMDTATGHLYGDSITCRVTPSDGTTTGLPVDSPAVTVRRLRQVSNILPGGNPRFANFTAWNDRVYFIASDMAGNGNSEIWVTDGTTTQLMLGTDPPGNTRPQDLTLWNSRLYFRGTVDGHSGEVWSSDGTSMDYTFRINVAGGSDVQLLRVIDDRLFMVADDGYQGREIFVSDDGVTVRVFADGMAGSAWMNVTDMGALLGDQLIFGGGGGDTGSEPHVVRDGLSGSTTLLGDLRSGWAGSNPRAFHSVHGVVVFVAQPSQPIVWRTDGSAAGTGPLGTLQAWNFFQRLPDGRIYATRFYNGQSMDMLSTDGTEAGTRLLFRVSGLGQSPGTQAVHDGRIWFSGTGPGGVGREFWVTDGTESGTAFVADVWPGADDSYASNFAVTSDGRVFFSAAVGTAGDYEVWVLE